MTETDKIVDIEKIIKSKIKELKPEIEKLPKGVDWYNPLMNFARKCLLDYKYSLNEYFNTRQTKPNRNQRRVKGVTDNESSLATSGERSVDKTGESRKAEVKK